MDIGQFLKEEEIYRNLLVSGILFITLSIFRLYIIRQIRLSKKIPFNDRRQWIVSVKTVSLFLLLIGSVIIWASELQSFAISLVAVAAAFAIAFKEVIMNMSGYFSRVISKPFSIGDRIEVGGTRGDVIDQNLFFTKILEIGPGQATNQYTGRSVNIPNSTFLSHSIINESFTEDFTLHVFTVPLLIEANLLNHKEQLLEACVNVCQPIMEQAKVAFDKFGRSQAIDPPSVDPRVYVRYVDKDTAELVARIPAPTSRKGRVEQEILSQFSNYYVVNRIDSPATKD